MAIQPPRNPKTHLTINIRDRQTQQIGFHVSIHAAEQAIARTEQRLLLPLSDIPRAQSAPLTLPHQHTGQSTVALSSLTLREVVVVEETRSPNMVHDHVLSYDGEVVVVEETPTLNMVHDHAISSEEREVAVVVENTPTLNMVQDHVVSSEEREVVVMKETQPFTRFMSIIFHLRDVMRE
ncbi:hypothetical protein GH714_029569 [Hevea brasiliensis]|uniref:Uncharacterized protein n=1 Tax=Hevea brasiliensis TaxID=3981 RepID=A0A6A6K979_HEVBR|nr:hypothetical protein GH714_029569 [Hevea brasiliensis]